MLLWVALLALIVVAPIVSAAQSEADALDSGGGEGSAGLCNECSAACCTSCSGGCCDVCPYTCLPPCYGLCSNPCHG